MKASLTVMKNLISTVPEGKEIYLTIIDEEGTIRSANGYMQKGLSIEDPRQARVNFFDLLHPVHSSHFRNIIREASLRKEQITAELFTRNKFYHLVKWQVSPLQPVDKQPFYFCVGYSVYDRDRIERFDKLLEKHCHVVLEDLAGIIFHDRRGEVVAANAQASQLLGTRFEELYQPDAIKALWTTLWKVADEWGNPVSLEQSPFIQSLKDKTVHRRLLQLTAATGEQRWLLFNTRPLAGDECFAVSKFVDVADERIPAQQRNEAESVMSAFVRQTPNMAWILDEDSRTLFASSAFCRQFNIDESSYRGKKMAELIPEKVYQSLYEKHVTVYETGLPLNSTEKIRLADGSNYISHVNLFPLTAANGKRLIGGYAVNLPDTSRLQTDLRQANERLVSLSQVASDAIWEWDMQGGKIIRNEALMRMIGYQPDNSKGLSWWLRRIHPEDRNRVSDKIKELTETNQQTWEDEYRFKCADGKYKHVRDKGFVIYENGLPVTMVGCLQDISALKELEDKLATERLRKQKDISETIIQVQEKERTRIGHELHDNVNQILSSAFLFTEMLKPSDGDQERAREKALKYISTAIEEIRKLSREMVVPQLREQGLVDGIQSLVADINLAHKVAFRFEHDLDPGVLSSGQRITLFRIVQEQVKNILTHSRATTAQIRLRKLDRDVELIIQDNGVGFDSHQTHRGIGLSNIYERIHFYNGKVDIQSSSGNGCKVVVTLPLD